MTTTTINNNINEVGNKEEADKIRVKSRKEAMKISQYASITTANFDGEEQKWL